MEEVPKEDTNTATPNKEEQEEKENGVVVGSGVKKPDHNKDNKHQPVETELISKQKRRKNEMKKKKKKGKEDKIEQEQKDKAAQRITQ